MNRMPCMDTVSSHKEHEAISVLQSPRLRGHVRRWLGQVGEKD